MDGTALPMPSIFLIRSGITSADFFIASLLLSPFRSILCRAQSVSHVRVLVAYGQSSPRILAAMDSIEQMSRIDNADPL